MIYKCQHEHGGARTVPCMFGCNHGIREGEALSGYMAERWRVRVENEKTRSGDWSVEEHGEIAEMVNAMAPYRPICTLVTESGLWVLPTQFGMPCADLLQHIADTHNNSLNAATP